tara:strand:+ start:6203 stop:6346 length:144 start_codon:yes stop_codon:yes gene_type:complete
VQDIEMGIFSFELENFAVNYKKSILNKREGVPFFKMQYFIGKNPSNP